MWWWIPCISHLKWSFDGSAPFSDKPKSAFDACSICDCKSDYFGLVTWAIPTDSRRGLHVFFVEQGCSTVDQIDATLLVNIVTPQQKFQSSQDLQSFHQCTCIRSPLKIEACNYIYILYIYIYLFIIYIYIHHKLQKDEATPTWRKRQNKTAGLSQASHLFPMSTLFWDTPACRPSY